VETLETRLALSATSYIATDLVSDQPGVAPVTDPTLINAWGLAVPASGGNFWVSSGGGDVSEVYGDTEPITPSLKVAIPNGEPTGQVFNGTSDFAVSDGMHSGPAFFIFAAESGTVSGWNPDVGVATGAMPPSVTAEVGFKASDDAIYKGIALAQSGGANYLYATDFHNGKIDVLDSQFHLAHLAGSFTDPNLPAGYAPFNVAAINGKLYVSYALQDDDAEDDVPGPGHGFISVFDTSGNFEKRLVTGGDLSSPWGMVVAPDEFGQFSHDLLVGNFGDGRIHAYDPATGDEIGTLNRAPGHPLVIDGLWGLAFGNGSGAGEADDLYYAAGPGDESHGVFGEISAQPQNASAVTAVLANGDLAITGSRESDHVRVNLVGHHQIMVIANGHNLGRFDAAKVDTIHFTGLAGNDHFSVSPRVEATVIADGGAGNDMLRGGGGSSILLGSTGDDFLHGGKKARNILIGGEGSDHLQGGKRSDILIGGSTTHDTNDQALMQILAAWNADTSSSDRIAVLRNGTNGVPKLDSTTVVDDGAADRLFGGQGTDWYFSTLPDRLLGRRSGEEIS
jgi:uncharacterized protein (TIGR03118 family)